VEGTGNKGGTGIIVGSYRLERVLARGGMATVWIARDLRTQQQVALKQILPEAAYDPEFVRRFSHEVQIHAALQHPNILRIFEYAAGPQDYFIAMELIDGGSLRMLLDKLLLLPIEIALVIARETLRGLSCAHASGIVHRDIKPQNVLVSRAGEVKVADFGISKTEHMTRLTQTGNLIGTPSYMSPEQATMAKVDARTDIFSTGVVLYEMLAGRNPFNTGNPVTTLKMVVEHAPKPLSEVDPRIAVECELVVGRMMAKNPDNRFGEARDAATAVDQLLTNLGVADGHNALCQFLRGPAAYQKGRYSELARRYLARGKALLESGTASDEVVLWQLYLAQSFDSENQEACGLANEVATRSSYRLDDPPNTRAEELEKRLEHDPNNVQLLLQLAKAHKLSRCFPKMMRTFFRLRSLDIRDSYLRGQVASLVAREGAPADAIAEPTGMSRALDTSPTLRMSAAARPAIPARQAPAPTVPVPTPTRTVAAPAQSPPAPTRAAPGPSAVETPTMRRVLPGVRPQIAQLPVQRARHGIPVSFMLGFGLAAALVLVGLWLVLFG
jgi:hypothetical protein